jgi:hypothetical protein
LSISALAQKKPPERLFRRRSLTIQTNDLLSPRKHPIGGDARCYKTPKPECTVTVTVVVCVRLPETPVIVIVKVPVVAALLAVNVSVLVAVAGLVPNAAVVPVPIPLAESVTAPVNPPLGFTVMVVAP